MTTKCRHLKKSSQKLLRNDEMKKLLIIFLIISLAALSGCGAFSKKSKKEQNNSQNNTENTDNDDETDGFDGFPGNDFEAPITDSSITNLDSLIQELNLAQYHNRGFRGQNLTIAVLDNGFMGIKRSIGRYLPPDTEVIDGSGNPQQQTTHGTKLAELIYTLATGEKTYKATTTGPRLLLFNTNGWTNFTEAIEEVIKRKVDIVLYSQIWEYGGNMNGSGFINQEVNKALNAGILWINASGNNHLSTYHADIKITNTQEVSLPFKNKYVRFKVQEDYTPCKIVLSWNDFANTKNYQTSQNLDLYLENESGEILSSSELIQDGLPHKDYRYYSAHAREIIKSVLKKGTYHLRVVAKSNNFNSLSALRITIDGYKVEMIDRTLDQTLLIPADNPGVLTIGAMDVNYSGRGLTSNGINKPELITPSTIKFEDGQEFQGTSSAAAIATAGLSVFMSGYGKLSRAQIVQYLNQGLLGSRESYRNSPSSGQNNSPSPQLNTWLPPVLRLPDLNSLY
ncbi:MAG: S8 family serine peptidase [Candidatus Lokiarchaeota archaeon]|nr:S8 family serine peptidase [Candidatus Lokiarchaeota archaeon]